MRISLHSKSLKTSERLGEIHDRLIQMVAGVDRVACTLYDPSEDTLRTFVNSTRGGEALKGYEYKLGMSEQLSQLARNGGFRLIEDIRSIVSPKNQHSIYILKQGYQTSLTVPMYDHGHFIGFIFYDSLLPSAFSLADQQLLLVFADLITLTIAHELDSIQMLTGAVSVSRAFSNMRDFETGAHLERMARYSRIIAKDLSDQIGISDEFVEHVYLFAPLHDLGKIGIPDSILLKPGKLTEEEWRIMLMHPAKGLELLDMVIQGFGLEDISDVEIMRNIVLHHHEMLDGTGYPCGLKGDEVPLEARITATADILDALTSRRSYKEPWSFDEAIEEMVRLADMNKLDERCVQAVIRHRSEIQEIHRHFHDTPAVPCELRRE